MISLRFQMKTYPCNRDLRSRYDNFAFSPPVHTETMQTIMKTQTFEYANQTGSIWKQKDMKTEQFENGSMYPGP